MGTLTKIRVSVLLIARKIYIVAMLKTYLGQASFLFTKSFRTLYEVALAFREIVMYINVIHYQQIMFNINIHLFTALCNLMKEFLIKYANYNVNLNMYISKLEGTHTITKCVAITKIPKNLVTTLIEY